MLSNKRVCNPLLERVIDHRRAGGMLGPSVEYRTATELRVAGQRLEGIAAPYETEAVIGNFSEVIRSGAFQQTLADGHDVLALVDHDPGRLLGRTSSGTLRLMETRAGLAFELSVPDTQLGRDTLALASRGDLGGCSIGFRPRVDGERWVGRRRELRALDLAEISIVHSWPAYSGTSIQARMATSRLGARRLWCETV